MGEAGSAWQLEVGYRVCGGVSYLGLMEMHICRRGPRLIPGRTELGVTRAILGASSSPSAGSGVLWDVGGQSQWPLTCEEGEANQHPQPLLLGLTAVWGGREPNHQPQCPQASQESKLGERETDEGWALPHPGGAGLGVPFLTWKRWVTTLM